MMIAKMRICSVLDEMQTINIKIRFNVMRQHFSPLTIQFKVNGAIPDTGTVGNSATALPHRGSNGVFTSVVMTTANTTTPKIRCAKKIMLLRKTAP